MASKARSLDANCPEKPNWQELFETVFAGGSTRLESNETWNSVCGMPVDVVGLSFKVYGKRLFNGKSPLEPLHWMWFLSYLKASCTWTFLALFWRVSNETFRRVVSGILQDLQGQMNEVRMLFLCFFGWGSPVFSFFFCQTIL